MFWLVSKRNWTKELRPLKPIECLGVAFIGSVDSQVIPIWADAEVRPEQSYSGWRTGGSWADRQVAHARPAYLLIISFICFGAWQIGNAYFLRIRTVRMDVHSVQRPSALGRSIFDHHQACVGFMCGSFGISLFSSLNSSCIRFSNFDPPFAWRSDRSWEKHIRRQV